MHVIEVPVTGGPEVLTYVEKPEPAPGPGQVLIKADAVGVNFIDTYFRSGLYPRPVPFVLGTEVCGTVAAVGDDVAAITPGDRVVTANASGAYAEFCTAPADFIAYVPDAVPSDAVASALLRPTLAWECASAADTTYSSERSPAAIARLAPLGLATRAENSMSG